MITEFLSLQMPWLQLRVWDATIGIGLLDFANLATVPTLPETNIAHGKLMVGILLSFSEGLFSVAMLVLGRVGTCSIPQGNITHNKISTSVAYNLISQYPVTKIIKNHIFDPYPWIESKRLKPKPTTAFKAKPTSVHSPITAPFGKSL